MSGFAKNVTFAHDDTLHRKMDHHEGEEENVGETDWSPAIIVHATFMLFSCFVLLPVGICLAIQQSKLHKWWQTFTVVFMALTVIPAIYASYGHEETSIHAVLGGLLLAGLILQFCAGWLIKYMNLKHMRGEFERRLKLMHRIVAGMIVLFIPFVILFGIAHAANIAEDDVNNYSAHFGFGIPLIVAGLGLQLPFSWFQQTEKRLYLENGVWFVFGIVIVLSQHDWLGDGLSNFAGDLQHELIGTMTVLTSVCGFAFLWLQRYTSTNFTIMPVFLRLPLVFLYSMLAIMMGFHNQTLEYPVVLHIAFAIAVLGIALCHLLNSSATAADYEPLQNVCFVLAGVIFCGAATTNVNHVMSALHVSMYLVVLFLIAILLLTWWNCMIVLFSKAFEQKHSKHVSFAPLESDEFSVECVVTS